MNNAMLSNPSSPGRKLEHAPDSILAVLKDAACSTRLMNAIAANMNDLPVNTIQDYMINPEKSRISFLQIPNLGVTSANELDKIMRNTTPCNTQVKPTTDAPDDMDDTMPSNSPDIPDPQEKSEYTPDSILEVLQNIGCSVRLMNVVTSNRYNLPVNTAQEYAMEPKRARENFLKLQNFGVTTANELDRIMQDFIPPLTNEATDENNMSEIRNVRQRAILAIESFCIGLQYPNDILENFPSDSLTNLLETERDCQHGPFSSFLKTYEQTVSRLRMRRGCSLKDINELDGIISMLLGKRLDACGVSREVEPYLRFLMRGGLPPRPMLDTMITLENIQPEILQAVETEPDEQRDISEIVSSAFSVLDERQFDILKRRYGIDMDRSETLEEISVSYGISRERIRQIQASSMKKLATRRMVKSLVTALKRENIVQDMFSNRKIITADRIGKIYDSLDIKKRLAINLAYGNMKSFLDAVSIRTKGAWVQEQDLHMLESGSEHLLESLERRINTALRKQYPPITLSEVISEIPDYPESVIRNEIMETMNISVNDDIIDASTLRGGIRYFMVLREAGHAMSMNDIRKETGRMFGNNDPIDRIQSTIIHDPDFLIVGRGTYNIYENLDLTTEDMADILNRVYCHLEDIGGFISVKVLFSRLFNDMTEHFGESFGHYMLLGLLHHDPRFKACRGLMIGLASEDKKTKYRSLGEDIRAVLLKSGKMMTLAEIVKHLETRRDVQETSVGMAIRKIPDAVQYGRGRYGMAEKIMENRG